jgi:uncharacterized protein (TIGR02145 family)
MKFVPAKCPSCNGDLQIPDDREFVKCMYCSTDIKVREVLNVRYDVNIPNLLKLGYSLIEVGDINRAIETFNKILENNSENYEAWLGLGYAYSNKNCNLSVDPSIYFSNAIKFAPRPEEFKRKLFGVWTTENLNVDRYRNGDPIPHVHENYKWSKLTTGAWCYYDNDQAKGKTYGKLYNWYAVNDSRGLAPEGWHVPSDAEWTKLTGYLGGEKEAGGKLKATTLWNSPNTGATNESGFTAFPGGCRNYDGSYYDVGEYGYFWSAAEDVNSYAWPRLLGYDGSGVSRNYYSKRLGFSIRCVRD